MYSIGKLSKEFDLSRSTLLYYDSIGLLKASKRTKSNYRMYSEDDRSRLGQINLYRKAGVALEQIKILLDSNEKSEENVLRKRLVELDKELYLIRLQKKIITEMLKNKNISDKVLMIDEKSFVSALKSSGVKKDSLENLHVEFERKFPDEHQIFLEFLGVNEGDIKYIRDKAKAEINKY